MTKTIKGRVQVVSDKQEDDYFGVCIDDNWYNGPGSLKKNLEEAEVELTVNTDDKFIDIEEIDILEEDSKGGKQTADNSDAGGSGARGSNSGGKTSSTPNPKRANIQATAATKKAADIVQEQSDFDNKGEYIEQVSEVANGLNNVMNKLYEANME